jgi:hypothetical protein
MLLTQKKLSNTSWFRLRGKKDKVVPVFNLIKHYKMKAYGGVDV